jgi:hypothetical protein
MILDDELMEAKEICETVQIIGFPVALFACVFGGFLYMGERWATVPVAFLATAGAGGLIMLVKARRVILKERNERRLKAMQKQLDEEIGK